MGMSGCSGAGAPAPLSTQVAAQGGGPATAPAPGKPIQGGGPELSAQFAPVLAELTKVIDQIRSLVGGISGGGPIQQGDPTQAGPGKLLGGGPPPLPAGGPPPGMMESMEIAGKALADLDADRNGRVTAADVTQHASTGSQFAYLAAAVMSLANSPSVDRGGIANLSLAFRFADGNIDKASFQSGLLAKGQELLARFDANRDGRLDSGESTALTNSLPR